MLPHLPTSVQPSTLQFADSRSSEFCSSDDRATFCFWTSLKSNALDVTAVAKDCCSLRYVGVSSIISVIVASSLRCLSPVSRNQNVSL